MEVAKIKLDTKVLDRLTRELDMNTDQVLRALSLQVEGEAKTRAPVDTGALKNSLHFERKSKKFYLVADSVEYGIYQELGTHKMAAQPFLVPAVEAVRKYLADKFKGLFE